MPMDLDAVSANIAFKYALFKAECVDKGIFHKCGKVFDNVHENRGYCPRLELEQLTLTQKLDMWKNWGGYVREKNQSAPPLRNNCLEKGKKREAVAEVEESPTLKRCEPENQSGGIPTGPLGSGMQLVSGIDLEPMSLGELLFEQQLSDAIYGDEEECKQDCCIKNFASQDNPPLFKGMISVFDKKMIPCTVLIDLGATSFFINDLYAHRNKMHLQLLKEKIRCRSFDGSLASSGDLTHYVDSSITVPLVSGQNVVSKVTLNVTKIATAEIILGSSWLRDSNCFVGGSQNEIVFKHSIQSSSCNEDPDVAQLLSKFADVFVTKALEGLPPH
jgi:hypothetical protein